MIYHGHSSSVWQLQFAPLGGYFASCSADRTANVWILKNSQPLRILAGQGGHLNDVEAIEWHPNMHYVATGSSDKQVIIWDVDSGNQVLQFMTVAGTVTSLKFNREGTLLLAGNDAGELVIFDVLEGVPLDVVKTQQDKAIWSLDISWED